jgi:small GTP-binding protein
MDRLPEYRLHVGGDAGVGKTTLLDALSHNPYSDVYVPTVFNYICAKAAVDGQMRKFLFTDVGHNYTDESSARTTDSLYTRGLRSGQGHLLFYSITSKTSFVSLQNWVLLVKKFTKNPKKYPVVVVGTKADLEDQRQVSTTTAAEWAKYHNWAHIEVSAKTRQNLQLLKELIVTAVDNSKLSTVARILK